eukprot:Skav220893  [mRNA]  locus=scaffold3880:52677:52940:- [translate_table: standard]
MGSKNFWSSDWSPIATAVALVVASCVELAELLGSAELAEVLASLVEVVAVVDSPPESGPKKLRSFHWRRPLSAPGDCSEDSTAVAAL